MLPNKRGRAASTTALKPLHDADDTKSDDARRDGPISSGVVTRVVSLDEIANARRLRSLSSKSSNDSARTITSAFQVSPDSEHVKTTVKATVGSGAFVGDYRIERPIGQGGMGAVYSAHHRTTGQPVAIKILAAELLDDPNGVPRFMREAGIASKLQSPHATRVIEVGTNPNGVPFIVMELLEGDTLHAFTATTPNQQLPAYVAIDFIAQACDAVGEAHERGIVHRDLKLGNLFLANVPGAKPKQCVLKVLDFGLAKPERRSKNDGAGGGGGGTDHRAELTLASLTQVGGIVFGTPYYMAPEQILGIRNLDARIDVWALGVCLYTMITGRYPFHGENPQQICSMVLSGDYVKPSVHRPDLSPAIEAIIARCLSTSAATRYANANELLLALRALVPGRMDLTCPATMTSTSPAPATTRDEALREDLREDLRDRTRVLQTAAIEPESQRTIVLATPIPPRPSPSSAPPPPPPPPPSSPAQSQGQAAQPRRVRRDVMRGEGDRHIVQDVSLPPLPGPSKRATPSMQTIVLLIAGVLLLVAFVTTFLLSRSGRFDRARASTSSVHNVMR